MPDLDALESVTLIQKLERAQAENNTCRCVYVFWGVCMYTRMYVYVCSGERDSDTETRDAQAEFNTCRSVNVFVFGVCMYARVYVNGCSGIYTCIRM